MRWRTSSQVHTGTTFRVGSGLAVSIEAFASTSFRRGVTTHHSLLEVEPDMLRMERR